MLITHSFLGAAIGKYRCLFFLLYEDYIDAQSQFTMDLEPLLERFARNLKDGGALVKPFLGDIESTRDQVLSKQWSDQERESIETTPGLLMINVDFEDFDPRVHPWLHMNIGERLQGSASAEDLARTMEHLAVAIHESEEDVFQVAHTTIYDLDFGDIANIFEISPNVLGISIDLGEGVDFLKKLARRLSSVKR